MASVKVFLFLATVWGIAQSRSLDPVLATVYTVRNLETAWKVCPGNSTIVQEKYNQVFTKVRNCYGKFSQSNQSICHSFELNVQRCSQPLVDFFVDCLPEKSKDIPPAVVKAATSMVETFCISSGELLLEVLNGCIYEFFDQENKTIKAECRGEKLRVMENFDKESPSISEICEYAHRLGDCWQEYVNQDCDSLKARELFSKFYNAAVSSCPKK